MCYRRYLGYAGVFKLALLLGVGACTFFGIEPWWKGVLREFHERRAVTATYTISGDAAIPVRATVTVNGASSRSVATADTALPNVTSLAIANDMSVVRYDFGERNPQLKKSDFYLTNLGTDPVLIYIDNKTKVPMGIDVFDWDTDDSYHAVAIQPGFQYVFTMPVPLRKHVTVKIVSQRNGVTEESEFEL